MLKSVCNNDIRIMFRPEDLEKGFSMSTIIRLQRFASSINYKFSYRNEWFWTGQTDVDWTHEEIEDLCRKIQALAGDLELRFQIEEHRFGLFTLHSDSLRANEVCRWMKEAEEAEKKRREEEENRCRAEGKPYILSYDEISSMLHGLNLDEMSLASLELNKPPKAYSPYREGEVICREERKEIIDTFDKLHRELPVERRRTASEKAEEFLQQMLKADEESARKQLEAGGMKGDLPVYPGLSIAFGKYEDAIFFIDEVFDMVFAQEWLEDEYVQNIICDIEGCEIVNPMTYRILMGERPMVYGPLDLSTGSKALILMYKMDSPLIDATRCGSNCAKWILDIAKKRPVRIVLRYIMELDDIGEFYCVNSGKLCNGYKEYLHEYMKWFQRES